MFKEVLGSSKAFQGVPGVLRSVSGNLRGVSASRTLVLGDPRGFQELSGIYETLQTVSGDIGGFREYQEI